MKTIEIGDVNPSLLDEIIVECMNGVSNTQFVCQTVFSGSTYRTMRSRFEEPDKLTVRDLKAIKRTCNIIIVY